MLRKWTFSNIHKDIALLNDNKNEEMHVAINDDRNISKGLLSRLKSGCMLLNK